MARRDRRTEIMQAAEKLFSTRRFHEVTLDDVICQARVGKGTVYRYFRDKEDLFFETAMSGFDELCELLLDAVPDNGPFERQLLEACRQITAFFGRRRAMFRMMHSEESRPLWRKAGFRGRWRERRQKIDAAVSQIIARGVDEGAVRPDVEPAVLARFLVGMLRTRSRDADEVGEEFVVALFLHGAGPR
jgi:TetR/AcrR family fatty acid metabolism transcriptional regulator